jgi:PAS domain S-box-containing protein
VREALRSRFARYALVPVLIGLAILLSELVQFLIPHSADYLFLAAILASGWLGGRGPGLLAALLAPFALDYFFLPPLYTLGISHEARFYVLPFLLSALAAAWMSSTLRGARQTRVLLQKSEEKFRRILTNQPDVAWTGDQNGRIVYISPKIERLVGYSSRELYAGGLQFVLSRVHADDFSRFQQATHALFSDRTPFEVEFRLQHKDGSWVWLSHRAAGTWEENGIVFADGVIADVSSRKWSELELQSKTAFLEAQVNSTVDGILVVDADNRRILQNRRIVEMFGIPSDLLLSAEQLPVRRHMLSLVKDPESVLAGLNSFPDHREETSRDEVELKDGTTLDMYSAPVNGKEGQCYGRIWTFRDITQRKRREDKLRQLSATVEQSPVSVVITDVGGRISYVNRKFTECTGYTLEEVSGKTPRVLNSGYSPRETYKKLWATILDGREWRGEFRNKKKNGELYWESASISPIVDANGAITHFVAVKEDITERRALESELRQVQKLEGIGQLAAGIAHEINTPTQFVTDNLTFLEDSWAATFRLLESYRAAVQDHGKELSPQLVESLSQEERRCDLNFIREEVPHAIAQSLDGARRVARIVRAMKEFSHPDLADKTEADLNQGIATTIAIARSEWKYVAEVVTDFDERLPPVVCYPGDVNQAVLNLIVNAAHAIKEKLQGNGRGQIAVRTRRCGQFAEIAVSDTGTGIPENIRTRIFDPFFTTKDVGVGTGQGLTLAHSVVVRKHHGKIWFESETGSGTTFFIHLPVDSAREQEGSDAETPSLCR